MAEKPSIMVRKFQLVAEKNKFRSLEEEHGLRLPASVSSLASQVGIFKKRYCFLYGTSKDSARLAEVLQHKTDDQPPKLRPAKLVGYHIKLWGQYPALLDGPPGNEVFGAAYEIQSPMEVVWLRAYETRKYAHRPCLIQLLDDAEEGDKEVKGNTFMWNGQPDELTEGEFSLEEWKQRQQQQKDGK